MAKIKVLPDILANRIAAGEIVERPASVVKELLENALDADAARVDVEARAGGKDLIRVRDDGEGMDRDDALLAFEHHATSKLREASDLDCIRTLGFRGEALPSIASVSRLTLKTAPRGRPELPGTQVDIHGGKVKDVREAAWAGGTEITIRDLFFNVPARRKFLRSDATESAHLVRLVTHYALARPGVFFTLVHNGRTVMDAPPVQAADERVLQVFGESFQRDMVPFRYEGADLACRGLLSPPHRKASSTEGQYFFINGRMVRDRVVSSALNAVYRGIIPGGTYPAAVVFLDIPFEEIDVNVHPAKTEVRFRNGWRVQDTLTRVMAEALRAGKSFAGLAVPPPFPPAGPPPVPEDVLPARGEDAGTETPRESGYTPDPVAARMDRVREILSRPWPGGAPAPLPGFREPGVSVHRPDAPPEEPRTPVGESPWRVLGQWRESFIVAVSREELVLIDQHVAHERVLYEEFLAQVRQGAVVRQNLLLPVNVSLSPHQAEIWDALEARLRANGFEVERFGPRDALVKAVPAVAGHCEAEALLQDLLTRLEDTPDALSVDDVRKRLAAGLACRAAVKINNPLSPETMAHIVGNLREAEDPTTCPHGRPVVLRLHVRDVEKSFKRS
ncbi:MAG: DNA mismatch repair endonuclease MutL [Acidobacteria bacterium]|nr:DNA mismatch repair endonuclease MutL [Acidobacteriota bacterium]